MIRKKLIEVSLPLRAINEESSRRKRKAPAGYPTTLHKWWAQRPLAACRAVIFASLVDDPSSRSDEFPSDEAQERERQRLFHIIEDLLLWENSNNEQVLGRARAEILKSTNGNPPPLLDPFCGGGSIPLEAQRLGLETHASDLNPVAVLITKALIEIPPRFANAPPVNPGAQKLKTHSAKWNDVKGLADDIRYYGKWMREEAENRIGYLFPKVTADDGREKEVVAWLWARTVLSPNPAFATSTVPLVSTWFLSSTKGREAYLEPIVAGNQYSFKVVHGSPSDRSTVSSGTKVGRGGNFRCLLSGSPIPVEYIREQGQAGHIGTRLLSIVIDGPRGRTYLSPDAQAPMPPVSAPEGVGEQIINYNPRDIRVQLYGLNRYRDLYTARQLVALTTLSDLVSEARLRVLDDAKHVLDESHAEEYAAAVATYLAIAVDRIADYGSTLATWRPKDNAMRSGFSKQAVAMTWDFAEGNPFARSSAGFDQCCEVVAACVELLPATGTGTCVQRDAAASLQRGEGRDIAICTDPPYYNNIGYADLSDFFYIWLRRSLSKIYPDLFSTLMVPKSQELTASQYRFGGDQEKADVFFELGLLETFRAIAHRQHAQFPFTIFYAFKQEEGESESERSSTGWEMMLQALVDAGFMIDGTWPMRTEGDNRQIGVGSNALASSILLALQGFEWAGDGNIG